MDTRKLAAFCQNAVPYAAGLNAAQARFEITDGPRLRMFLAQLAHESRWFTSTVESLFYTHAERVARIFRRAFDRDRDGAISQLEIENAEPYVRQPQKLANLVYAGRNGNGDEASGDGWRFRARGPIGLTGRANYLAASLFIHGDDRYVRNPDLVCDPFEGALVAGWYWHRAGCNELADRGDFDAITRKINGGMNGAAERHECLETVAKYLG